MIGSVISNVYDDPTKLFFKILIVNFKVIPVLEVGEYQKEKILQNETLVSEIIVNEN